MPNDNQWEQAYQNFRLVKDIPAQIEFLDEYGMSMLSSGRNQLLVRWVEELPDVGTLRCVASLMAAYGKGLVLTGESERGIQILSQAESILRQRE